MFHHLISLCRYNRPALVAVAPGISVSPPDQGTMLLLHVRGPDQKIIPNLEDVNLHQPPKKKRYSVPEGVEPGTFVHLLVMLLLRLEML
jgi:hypothetical protein